MRLIFFMLLLSSLPVWACSPPPGDYSVAGNVERANLIAIVHVIKAEEVENYEPDSPVNYGVKISYRLMETIKGKSENIDMVYSDYSMCSAHLLPGFDYILFATSANRSKPYFALGRLGGTMSYMPNRKENSEYLDSVRKEIKRKKSPITLKKKQK